MTLSKRILLFTLSLLLPLHGFAANVMPLQTVDKLGSVISQASVSDAVVTMDSVATQPPVRLESRSQRPCHGHASTQDAGHARAPEAVSQQVDAKSHEQVSARHPGELGMDGNHESACGECAACVACHLQALAASSPLPSVEEFSGDPNVERATALFSVSLPGPAKPPKSGV